MKHSLWEMEEGDDPIVATAIHDGHDLREEVAAIMALTDSERLREEDPHTGGWTRVAANRVVPHRSRFEVDLNRPRDRAVYLSPEDAWGLQVWNQEPSRDLIERSLADYDRFYAEMDRLLSALSQRFGCFIVLDLHSYNHQRAGSGEAPADLEGNPEVNLGTGTMDRERWAPVVERFLRGLRGFDFLGRNLDVRENVRFRGGSFSRWVHQSFPRTGCCLAIEFKKFFMNEWTGKVDSAELKAIPRALQSTLPELRAELQGLRANA